MKSKKITVTLRLKPEDALRVLAYCNENGFIKEKQYLAKSKVAISEVDVL